MEPWYKVATLRKEVREGRSFDPDEFAIHLEQVIAKTAPEDYRDPRQFFARTCFTRVLREQAAMVLRRLSGETANTAPVITLITQFGGGKTHILTALYHLATNGAKAADYPGVENLISEAGIKVIPEAKVAAFVGNAWDPQEGRETPWIDLARQLAGDDGVRELGPAAKTTPPGTETLDRVFKAANGPVLILFDEVLNFINRHRGMAEQFHSFIQNLTSATTGKTQAVAVISLPRSQVEMTDWDMQWQDKITKVVRRVAKDLIANDETEISEVICRRLFEDTGDDRIRKSVSKSYADWCFERRAQLPSEWTAVDSATTEAKSREYLRGRFEGCYPFHPATLSVFQRKWRALPQYQQTRGTLAMLAQWISRAYRTGFTEARREPLLTLGSAPLEISDFQSVVLGQLGETRLIAAIDADISGAQSHARALDADTKGALRNIHRRVGTTILFESSGGQTDKVAHLPEIRFALGEPELDTTSIDTAALSLEAKSFFIRRVGSDGFKIGHQPTMKKVVNDRLASLDEETEIKPAMRQLIQKEFDRAASIPIVSFPRDGTAIQDTPKLTLVVVEPGSEWTGTGNLRQQIAEWTKQRGRSPRLYPGSLVWCLKKPGRDFREKVELWLAWRRVAKEIAEGTLGGEFDRVERAGIQSNVMEAEDDAKENVWGDYRFIVLYGEVSQPVDGFDASRIETLDNPLRGKLRYEPERKALVLREALSEIEKTVLERTWPDRKGCLAAIFKQADQGVFDDGLRTIDLGAGHSSSTETLCGRVITALKSQALLNEAVGAGYIERNWPPALKDSGAWPLSSLRQSFLNGSLTRLLDPDTILRSKIVEFVSRGDFGLASGHQPGGGYDRVIFNEFVDSADVLFESGVFLLLRTKVKALKFKPEPVPHSGKGPIIDYGNQPDLSPISEPDQEPHSEPAPNQICKTITISGNIPPEIWNRLGTKILPKLRSGADLKIGVEFSVAVDGKFSRSFETDIEQILEDLGLSGRMHVEEKNRE